MRLFSFCVLMIVIIYCGDSKGCIIGFWDLK